MAQKAQDLLQSVERRQKALKKHWLDAAEKVVDIYEAEEGERTPFNILYSNTETILPALYNSTPRPEVARRFTQVGAEKSLDSIVAQVSERVLEYSCDSNSGEYETFDAAVRGAVLKALVPGMGTVRVRYKEEGRYQEICYESVAYDRFVWGYARKWVDVPWVAFGHDLSRADFEAQFPEFARKKVYTEYKWDETDPDSDEDEAKRRDEAGTKKEPTLLVWEVWTASAKTVQFVCGTFRTEFIKEEEYPFALTARFPMAEPLKFVLRNDNLTPVPPYTLYEKQAQELNEVTRRLHLVLKAIKVRGGYNGQMTEIGTILDSDDTTLIPVENASMLAESGGFDKHIWFMPLEQLMNVAKALYEAQQSAKQTIYEIMGIGDILRGTSAASETARAQEIKNQWGSLRIKRAQKDVMAFCRDLFRVTLEFAANLYTPATLAQITKLPLLSQGRKQMLSQAAQGGAQLPPEAQLSLSLPTWEEVIGVLRDRFERSYRVDVETNSTVDLEATEDKAQIAEFMNAWGQMMAGIQPMVDSGAMPFEVAKLIMGEVFRRFRFARRVEQALDLIQQPQPKEDPKMVEERHKAQMEKVQAEAKRTVGEMQESIIESTGEIERLRLKVQELTMGASLKDREVAIDQKTQANQLKQDYTGKVGQVREQMSKMQDQQMLQQVQQLIQQGLAEIQAAVGGFKQEQAATQKVMAAKEQVAAVKAEAPMQMAEQMQAAISQLAENQAAMMEALQQVAAVAGADREAELYVGEDGRKRSRSRIVMQ